ncbi:hypothetical protein SAMN04487936_10374 [Halobacillus dabanensis]|uniref:Uncharacterized protein n=1 Tax=Halobacillus dabanensis TaxID=240302 RepID=A0A1I3SW52_HALDA|nr:hypothetical protein [Halobacillus dabanensis]SFJ61567.1 hypothetical protein SAMN04487936_10374 [Halobacillus dabanensis]
MTERQLIYGNMGMVITFGLFLFLSFVTAEADATQDVMILISEIVGSITLISAIVSLFYIKSTQRYLPIANLCFLVPWILYAIGFELGFDETTNYSWIWFIGLYLLLITGFIFLRISYRRIEGYFKLLPVFLLFINGIFFVYLIFIHIWWSIPFI